MTTEEIINNLTELNEWRRGGEGEMPDPKLIGITIDEAINKLKKQLHSVSDCFSFTRYLNENFHYFDNTDVGDVYKHKNGDGLYSEEDIFDEWLNNR